MSILEDKKEFFIFVWRSSVIFKNSCELLIWFCKFDY